jgi:YHS domain-containing protein
MIIDPVCGIDLEESEAASTLEFEGRTYYFCSEICREEFEENPHRFAVETSAAAPV